MDVNRKIEVTGGIIKPDLEDTYSPLGRFPEGKIEITEGIINPDLEDTYSPLGRFPEVVNRVLKADKRTIHLLHLLLYSASKEVENARKNILRFRGFAYQETSNFDNQKNFLQKLLYLELCNIGHVLHVNVLNKTDEAIIDNILFICKGPFETLCQANYEDWSTVTRCPINEKVMESENVFDDMMIYLNIKKDWINDIKEIVKALENFPISFKQEIEALQTNQFNLKELCRNVRANFFVIGMLYRKLNTIIVELSKDFFNLYEEYWKPVTYDILSIAAHIHFFETEKFITLHEAFNFLGLEENGPLAVTEVDVLISLLKFFGKLGELSEIALLAENYIFPYKAYKVMLSFTKLYHSILLRKDYRFYRKVKDLKWSSSKIVSALYNAKLRKGVTHFSPSRNCFSDVDEECK